jgi:3-deoxy-D-manno-octulosonic-acid transferase
MATATGYERAQHLFGDLLQPKKAGPTLSLAYAPFDLPGAARRFLRAHQPVAALFLETELWPNLIAAAAGQGVPVALISARVSARSTQRYSRFASRLMRSTLGHIRLIATQSDADSQRFLRLGASESSVHEIGNIKFDFPLPAGLAVRAELLRTKLGPTRPVWVAGSTHAGEEQQCLAAHRTLLQQTFERGAAPLLVLAPRHPERFEHVAQWLQAQEIRFARHSLGNPVAADTELLLLDTLGELLNFYAACNVAFVGGSLVPVGGHNLLEPAALSKPTITGPHTFAAPDAARLLEDANGLIRVSDADSLAAALWTLFSNPQEAVASGGRAALAVATNRGATERALALLEPMLPPV